MSAEYDLQSVKLPYMSGALIRLFAMLAEGPLRSLLAPSLFKSAGITWFREQHFDEPPTYLPIHHRGEMASYAGALPRETWPLGPPRGETGFRFSSVEDYANAYREGSTSPEKIAERVLEAIEASERNTPPLRAFIATHREDLLKQARESAERISNGEPLSPLDGVPVTVKDEFDMLPYPTTVGTAFLGKSPAKADATVVARMRAAGALLIGKANMHEVGIGVTGLNPIHGTTRNPYNPAHHTGGSSSGPATAVAAGLSPLAIGADGGGSIRVPASFCGLVGLKPTYGRLSEHGAAPLTWSMGHIGPLATSASDAALGYAVMAGPDPKDPNSLHQPTPTLEGWEDLDLSDLTLGIYPPWFEHAAPEVVSVCQAAAEKLEALGATIREISVPDLESARVAHVITIGAEMAQALDRTYPDHHKEHGLDVRINLALSRMFTAMDYTKAQRARTRTLANFAKILGEVDVILTPASGIVAPPINEAALSGGESDLTTLMEIMRFATVPNLTGLPAISFPAGYDSKGMPIGLQAIGRAWEETTLLRLALAAESFVEKRKPQVYYQILD